jgi:hypothetical protein
MTILALIILVASLMIAGHFKGKMDAVADENEKSADWLKKYDLSKFRKNHWWYFKLYTPKLPEKFPFSSTILVFLTDRWHMNQFFMLRGFYLAVAISITTNIWMLLLYTCVVMPVIVGIMFEVSYNNYRNKISNKQHSNVSGDEPYDNPQVTSVPEKQINQ